MKKPSLIFFGTPHFVTPTLTALAEQFKVLAVVTQPDKPVGRKKILTPPPIKEIAENLSIKIFQPHKVVEIQQELQTLHPDFIITFAYGEYLPESILSIPTKKALNIHPSLLPKYRGATPIQSALLNGDETTGVSIIEMTKEMDAGNIYAQEELDIAPNNTNEDLQQKAEPIATKLIVQVITQLTNIKLSPDKGRCPDLVGTEGSFHLPKSQDKSLVTTCKKITKEDGLINWSTESAAQIYNQFRAFQPWPGIHTQYNGQKLSILFCKPHSMADQGGNPGDIAKEENKILVQCKEGSLELLEVQLAGKNPTDIRSFINGHPEFIKGKL
jgi:methionyl-tRNA formyltransferase